MTDKNTKIWLLLDTKLCILLIIIGLIWFLWGWFLGVTMAGGFDCLTPTTCEAIKAGSS